MASEEEQFEFDCSLKDNNASLVITVRDKKNLRKFTNTYTPTSLAAKGLTQAIEKLTKILKTAAKNKKENWSMIYGYASNPKSSQKTDLMPTYLTKSDISSIRKKPKSSDTLFIILKINEDFFTVDTQFKLYEIEKPDKLKKTRSRRTASNVSGKMTAPGSPYEDDQKIADMEAKIKSLTRDNQVLKRKLEKLESASGKKQKKMDNEREMRLQANKERFWLKQKLERLQKAIAARLKILGVDFSKVDDITSALDMAFNVIQKLAKQLQQKEEEFEEMKSKMDKAVKEASDLRKNKDKQDATIEKLNGVMRDLRKQIADRDRRLSIVAHEKNDSENMLTKQLEDLQNETKQLREEKEKLYNQMVDEKAKLKGELDDKLAELEDIKNELNKAKEENKALSAENEQIKEDNEKLLNKNSDLDAKLQEAMKEIEELKNELEAEKNKNVELIRDNDKLKKEVKRLLHDLARLKELLEKACSIEVQLKSALDDSTQLLQDMSKYEVSELIGDDDDED